MKSQCWCFTLNNYSDAEFEEIFNWDCQYIVLGKEIGESGTPHIQGYVEFNSKRHFTALCKINERIHWEPRKGNSKQAADYIKCNPDKPEPVFQERGIRSMTQDEKGAAGKRKYEEYWSAAVEGRLMDIDAKVRITQYNTLKKIERDYMVRPPDLERCAGIWVYGESGCGKTHYSRAEFPNYFHKKPDKWWDGYRSDYDAVIVEDIDPYKAKDLVFECKMWADKYSFAADVKGGTVWIRPKVVVFTSQYTIEQCFALTDSPTIEAMQRRCKVIHYSKSFW